MLTVGDTYTTSTSKVSGTVAGFAPHNGGQGIVRMALATEQGIKWTSIPASLAPHASEWEAIGASL